MRTFLAFLYVVPATCVTWLGALLVWPLSRQGRLGQRFMRLWSRGFLFCAGLRYDVEGMERARGGPFLLVANHASMLDIPFISAAISIQFLFVSRPFFFYVPLIGWGMRATRQISLDPRKPREAARVLRGLHSYFDRGISIILFPEGTRSPDGAVHTFRRGPFVTAIENGVPVLPLCLSGLHDALPKGSLRLRAHRLRLAVGDPIETRGLTRSDARTMAARVEAWTRETKARLDGKTSSEP